MSPERIIVATALRHGLPASTLIGPERRHDVCRIRHEAVARAIAAGIPETEIARALNRDQTTIRNSLRRYEEQAND